MKQLCCLLVMIGLISCQPSEESVNYRDYITWKNNTGHYREYQYVKDSLLFRVFIRLSTRQVDDST